VGFQRFVDLCRRNDLRNVLLRLSHLPCVIGKPASFSREEAALAVGLSGRTLDKVAQIEKRAKWPFNFVQS
jgi:hypothetical protein